MAAREQLTLGRFFGGSGSGGSGAASTRTTPERLQPLQKPPSELQFEQIKKRIKDNMIFAPREKNSDGSYK